MSSVVTKIPAALIRGGTSKGLFINAADLPSDKNEIDQLLLAIMGSPDPTGMQLNGIGGGISSTSKVAIIKKSKRLGIDVDYLFGQVHLTEAKIDWSGSCGNLAAAVGLYAIHFGLASANQDACVCVWQENLGYEIKINIPRYSENELIAIAGVPGVGTPIYVEFIDPTGGKSLLPDNKPIHDLILPSGQKIKATLILGANPIIFVRATDLGLIGTELPKQLDYAYLQPIIKTLGEQGATIMNIAYNAAVRVAWLAEAKDYLTSDGITINSNQFNILSRITTEGRVHHAHTGTGAINLACAAKIPGTIPYQIITANNNFKNINSSVGIGHPQGIMHVNATVICDSAGRWIAESAGFIRTAKIIMVGEMFK